MYSNRRVIGSYQLLRRLRSDGYTQAYLAKQLHVDVTCAVKIFKYRYEDNVQQAFLKEAKLSATLHHPHILPVLDYGIEDGRCYLVSKYASHGSLRDRLSQGERFPLETTLLYIQQLGEAIQYAHENNIIHRDIKPENILFTENDEVVLADFGLACLQNSSFHDVSRHITIANPVYAAPERYQGIVSQANDIYSLGVIAYEWFTGMLPPNNVHHVHSFRPDNQEKMEQDGNHYHSVPVALEQAVMKALAEDPTKRYPSVNQFLHALQSAVDNKQDSEKYSTAFPDSEQSPARHWMKSSVAPKKHDTFPLLTKCLAQSYIEQAFATLPWIERNCLFLYVDAEFTKSDIAAILDLDQRAVQRYLKQASKQWLHTYTSLVEKELGDAVGRSLVARPEETIACVKKLVQAQGR